MPRMTKYFEALERLRKRGAVITADAVALEAGVGKGAIKRHRESFAALLREIDNEKGKQRASTDAFDVKLALAKEELRNCREKLNESLAREVALVMNVFDLRRQIKELTAGRVVPIRKR